MKAVKVVTMSNSLQRAGMRQGEFATVKTMFFTEPLAASCCNATGRVVTEPKKFKSSLINLFH
jgi:hypothetical protein